MPSDTSHLLACTTRLDETAVKFVQNSAVRSKPDAYGSTDFTTNKKDDTVKDDSCRTLKKTVGYGAGFSLMIGLILGSGIFISPKIVAMDTSSAGMMLVVWAVAGVFAMMGALCYCELGGLFKVSGGTYLNILKTYGRIPGFLCAWTTCLVIDPSSCSAVALTIGLYLAKPFYATETEAEVAAKIIAFVAIVIAMTLNCTSSKYINRAQKCLAVAQLSSVLFLISVGIWQLSLGNVSNFHGMFNGTNITAGVGISVFGALWSFDGWSCMNNIVEEMTNVERDLLLVIVTAFPVVIVCYLLVNISLLTLLSRAQIAAEEAVGVSFVQHAAGKNLSYLMMVLVGLSAYGTLNGSVFAIPRLTLAAAREGHMPKIFSLIHKRTRSPVPSTLLTCVIAMLMLIPSASGLNSLIMLFSQGQWLIYSASLFGVVVLRIRLPHEKRPFRVFLGIPILMSIVSIVLVVIPFWRNPFCSLGLFGFILAGLPVYAVFVHLHDRLPNVFLRLMESSSTTLETRCNMVPCEVD